MKENNDKGSQDTQEQEHGGEYGECLKNLRQIMGYSQTNLAEKLGIKRGAIARLESGETLPSLGLLNRVSSLAKQSQKHFKKEVKHLASLKLNNSELVDSVEAAGEAAVTEFERNPSDDGDSGLLWLLGLGVLAFLGMSWSKNIV